MELLNLYTAILRRKWLLIQAIVFFTVAGALTAMLLWCLDVLWPRTETEPCQTYRLILMDRSL